MTTSAAYQAFGDDAFQIAEKDCFLCKDVKELECTYRIQKILVTKLQNLSEEGGKEGS